MTTALPSFSAPPVVEVVLSAQFAAPEWYAPQLGLFWEGIRSDFPRINEHPPLPPIRAASPGVQFEIVERLPMARHWFVSADGRMVIQVQRDRFAHNGRKVDPGDEYPRYPELRERFERRFRAFASCISPGDESEVCPDWCEVSYVNHLQVGHSDLGAALRLVSPVDAGSTLDDMSVTARFAQPAPEGERTLTLTAWPASRAPGGEPIYVMELTARGRVGQPGIEGVMEALDAGRGWIVTTFAELTTETMHRRWGRTR